MVAKVILRIKIHNFFNLPFTNHHTIANITTPSEEPRALDDHTRRNALYPTGQTIRLRITISKKFTPSKEIFAAHPQTIDTGRRNDVLPDTILLNYDNDHPNKRTTAL